jgi:hypothetical protein
MNREERKGRKVFHYFALLAAFAVNLVTKLLSMETTVPAPGKRTNALLTHAG